MNTLLDIMDILSDAYPVVVIFLACLLAIAYLNRVQETDHEVALRRKWDEMGFDAWLELWEEQEQEQGR